MSTENDTSSEENAPTEGEEDRLQAKIARTHFQEFLDIVQAVADECILRVDEDGFHVSAVDPANVAIAEVDLRSGAFIEYETNNTTMGLPVYKIQDILKHHEDETHIKLALHSDTRKLDVSAGAYCYTLALVDPDSLRDEPNTPSLDDQPAELDIGRNRFFKAVEYFSEFTTHVTVGFDSREREFYMEAIEKNGTRVGTDEGEFVVPESDLDYVLKGGDADSSYSLDYLREFKEGSPEYGKLTLRVGEEFPMKIIQEFAPEETGPESGVFYGEVTYMIAPRIGDN